MTSRLFWILVALLTAVAAHVITILYLPGLMFERHFRQIAGEAKANSFYVMKPEAQASLLIGASPQDIVGICLINLANGKVTVTPHVPQGLWSFAIYNGSGQQIYGINDQQAAESIFSVDITKARSLSQQIFGKAEAVEVNAIQDAGKHAQIVGNSGLAILWVPVADSAQRKALETQVKATSCGS